MRLRERAGARQEYIRTFTFSRDYDVGRRPRVLSRRRENSVAASGSGIRVEKCISPGGKVELLALIGEFVFTIGLGFSDGVEGLGDLSLYVESTHIHILLYISYGQTQGICMRIFHIAIKNEMK